jgi:hypothetical protein
MGATQKAGSYCSQLDSNWFNDRERPSPEEAEARIHEIYDSGQVFFTKKAISDLGAQLERNPQRGDKIITTDLNGDNVEFEVQTGQIREFRDSNDVKGACI